MNKATLITDKLDPHTYRVEFIDTDGSCEVAIFSGPNALVRASDFGIDYYDVLEDPEGLLK